MQAKCFTKRVKILCVIMSNMKHQYRHGDRERSYGPLRAQYTCSAEEGIWLIGSKDGQNDQDFNL